MRSPRPLLAAVLSVIACFTIEAPLLTAAEIIVDNADPGFKVLSSQWRTGKVGKMWGRDFRLHLASPGKVTAEVEWRPTIPADGNYEVAVWFPFSTSYAPDAEFTVESVRGREPASVNERTDGGQWHVLGVYPFKAGTEGRVVLSNAAKSGLVVADAVRFRAVEAAADSQPAPASAPVASAPAAAEKTRPPWGSTAPEFRALWVSRFEWPSPDAAKSQGVIDGIMADMGKHNFNAVMFQVRGQCDTFYPSTDEPWSDAISPTGADPGWDPLAYALKAAHDQKLEFHAYINTHVGWQSQAHKPPTNPKHPFFKHFNAADPNARDWLLQCEPGAPSQYREDGYVWLAPGVPSLQAYLRKQVLDVIRRYEVDGVHFDRIRSACVSQDPISTARMQPGSEGNPAGLSPDDWTRDQFTRMLCDLYAQAAEIKPKVKISSAPLGLYAQDRYPNYPASFQYGMRVFQDSQAWLAAGAMDFIAPQIYWLDGERTPRFSEVLPDWLAHAAGRHVYPGLSVRTNPVGMAGIVNTARQKGALGTLIFSYRGFKSGNNFPFFSNPRGPYARAVPVPEMPWKARPTEGIILGTLTDASSGQPVLDGQIQRTGSNYVALSSADGVYSFLKVPPGAYTLTFKKRGLPDKIVEGVQVAAGAVVRLNAALGAPVVALVEPKAPPEPPVPQMAPAKVTTSSPSTAPEGLAAGEAAVTDHRPETKPSPVQAQATPAHRPTRLWAWIVFPLLIIIGTVVIVLVVFRVVNQGR
jgi:uncharacterized lipoprotein YddW (UPF0748 family)